MARVTSAVTKHHKQLEEEPHHNSSLKVVMAGTQARQELRGRSWHRGHGGAAYWLAFPGLLGVFLLPRGGTIHKEMSLPT